jgi:hypothetical protein
VTTTKPCLEPGCLPLPKRAGNPVRCEWHWLARQPAVIQAEAAAARLAKARAGGKPDVARIVPQLWPEGFRWCAGCQSMVPLFYARGSRCRSCASEASHRARVETTYALEPGEYDALLKLQGGRCAICRCRPEAQRLAVDHDHQTNAVRGLLCVRCNHDLLGAAHDRLDILRAAVAYLEHSPAREGTRWQEDAMLSGWFGSEAPAYEQPATHPGSRAAYRRRGQSSQS